MSELYCLYHIIPRDDLCSFIYKDSKGEYKTKSKSLCTKPIDGDKLIFLDECEAGAYIARYLDTNKYMVGPFLGNKALYDEARKDTSVSFVNGTARVNNDHKRII